MMIDVLELQREVAEIERHRSKRFTPRPLPPPAPHPEMYVVCLHCPHADTDGMWRCCHCNAPFKTIAAECYSPKTLSYEINL